MLIAFILYLAPKKSTPERGKGGAKMKQNLRFFIAICLVLAAAGLSYYVYTQNRPSAPNAYVEIRGVLKYVDVETGCWTVETELELQSYPPQKVIVRYQPLGVRFNMEDSGREIVIKGRIRDDIATICMTGISLEIQSYKFVP